MNETGTNLQRFNLVTKLPFLCFKKMVTKLPLVCWWGRKEEELGRWRRRGEPRKTGSCSSLCTWCSGTGSEHHDHYYHHQTRWTQEDWFMFVTLYLNKVIIIRIIISSIIIIINTIIISIIISIIIISRQGGQRKGGCYWSEVKINSFQDPNSGTVSLKSFLLLDFLIGEVLALGHSLLNTIQLEGKTL